MNSGGCVTEITDGLGGADEGDIGLNMSCTRDKLYHDMSCRAMPCHAKASKQDGETITRWNKDI